ncbi:hypothetical protein [Microbulbifer sp. A4B17]|uniref:hypothetical protein n=1 Tax=Microbulbifer sp. A4B17 TaxID=359370 RepID=UPI001300A2E8|nr:hypothetical protein [Microbulbifer sp. A4B17]
MTISALIIALVLAIVRYIAAVDGPSPVCPSTPAITAVAQPLPASELGFGAIAIFRHN